MSVDRSLRVLVVDDYRTMIRILRNLLSQLGFTEVDDASDGAEALRKMREEDYDLVISDWNMEPMTGIDLLQAVRTDDELAETPFIMLTSECTGDPAGEAREAGASNTIVKPFDAATLRNKIAAVFDPALRA